MSNSPPSAHLDVAVRACSVEVWDLEGAVEAQLQVVALIADEVPGTLRVGRERLGVVGRCYRTRVCMDHPSTTWDKKQQRKQSYDTVNDSFREFARVIFPTFECISNRS